MQNIKNDEYPASDNLRIRKSIYHLFWDLLHFLRQGNLQLRNVTHDVGEELSVREDLPLDIWENVIDFLVVPDDRGSYRRCYRDLLSCALTCRAWLHRSLHDLYHVVELSHPDQVRQFMTSVTKCSSLGFSVKELSIWPVGKSKAVGIFPLMLARKLSQLSSLTLNLSSTEDLLFPQVHSHFFLCLSEFPSLRQLELNGVKFTSVTMFGHLIHSLPNLSSLICHAVRFSKHDFSPGAFLRDNHCPRLRHLAMRLMPMPDTLIHCIQTATSTACLTSVLLPQIQNQDVRGVEEFVQGLGSSLELLGLGVHVQSIGDGMIIEEAIKTHQISVNNASLKFISLHLRDGTDWIASILSHIQSRCVSSVTLIVPYDMGRAQLDRLDFSRISAALARPQFAKMEELVFASSPYANVTLMNWLEAELLPRLRNPRLREIARVDRRPVDRKWWQFALSVQDTSSKDTLFVIDRRNG